MPGRTIAGAVALLCMGAAPAPPTGALSGTWVSDSYVDTPEGGAPTYPFGQHPLGAFTFEADGHFSIDIMADPAAEAKPDRDSGNVPNW